MNLIRKKTHFPYHVTLFEDACEALRTLYADRVTKTGNQVNYLFVTAEGKPFTRNAYDKFWDVLRERAGLGQSTNIAERQRVHAHGTETSSEPKPSYTV